MTFKCKTLTYTHTLSGVALPISKQQQIQKYVIAQFHNELFIIVVRIHSHSFCLALLLYFIHSTIHYSIPFSLGHSHFSFALVCVRIFLWKFSSTRATIRRRHSAVSKCDYFFFFLFASLVLRFRRIRRQFRNSTHWTSVLFFFFYFSMSSSRRRSRFGLKKIFNDRTKLNNKL